MCIMEVCYSLVNLCDPIFKTHISCNTVSSEGYEVTNLLSDDRERRRNGFLGDRFIKPPVEISIRFPFDVHIRNIQIGTVVGQQRSSGVEIYSSGIPYNSSTCSGSSASNLTQKSGLGFSTVPERIALVVLNDDENGAVVYCPLHYGRQTVNPVSNAKPDYVQKAMVWKSRLAITHTESLTIRIFRTSCSSIPALGSLEIWGGPSSCLPAGHTLDIMNLWRSAQERQFSFKRHELQGEEKNSTFQAPLKIGEPSFADSQVDVPDEFLDAITCEIMALPMVLPSGKVVDQKTLDLHAQAEAKWGRQPGDPFTGIMFSDGCRPILDSSLKARIDRFLVLNQDREDLKTVPRTVGRKRPHTSSQSVSVNNRDKVVDIRGERPQLFYSSLHRGGAPHIQGLSSKPSVKTQNFSIQRSVLRNDTLPKAMSSTMSFQPKKSKLLDSTLTRAESKESLQSNDDIVCLTPQETRIPFDSKKRLMDDAGSHERKIDMSLDFALKAALSALPSFVNPSVVATVSEECGSCKVSKSLYSLPCSHFLCRLCLINLSRQKPPKCQSCQVEFKSGDPVVHHK